jgi:hypothetical protein
MTKKCVYFYFSHSFSFTCAKRQTEDETYERNVLDVWLGVLGAFRVAESSASDMQDRSADKTKDKTRLRSLRRGRVMMHDA